MQRLIHSIFDSIVVYTNGYTINLSFQLSDWIAISVYLPCDADVFSGVGNQFDQIGENLPNVE